MIKVLVKLFDLKLFQLDKIKKIVLFFVSFCMMKLVEVIIFVEGKMGFFEYLKKWGNEGNKLEKGFDDLCDIKVVVKKFKMIFDFFVYVDYMRVVEKNKMGENGVQLMIIYWLKGFEFKIVYVLGVVDGLILYDFLLEIVRKGDEVFFEEER